MNHSVIIILFFTLLGTGFMMGPPPKTGHPGPVAPKQKPVPSIHQVKLSCPNIEFVRKHVNPGPDVGPNAAFDYSLAARFDLVHFNHIIEGDNVYAMRTNGRCVNVHPAPMFEVRLWPVEERRVELYTPYCTVEHNVDTGHILIETIKCSWTPDGELIPWEDLFEQSGLLREE